MAKLPDLPKVRPLSVEETPTVSQRWGKWVKSFENYLLASGITDKKQQRAVLLHLANPDVQDLFETLTLALEDIVNDLDTALAKLTAYFEPQKNIAFVHDNFR